jgi:Phage holin T7 family, holin superfamily II
MSEVVKASPAIGVAGMKLFGIVLADWVLILTIVWTLFLIIDKAPSVWDKLCLLGRKLRGKSN